MGTPEVEIQLHYNCIGTLFFIRMFHYGTCVLEFDLSVPGIIFYYGQSMTDRTIIAAIIYYLREHELGEKAGLHRFDVYFGMNTVGIVDSQTGRLVPNGSDPDLYPDLTETIETHGYYWFLSKPFEYWLRSKERRRIL